MTTLPVDTQRRVERSIRRVERLATTQSQLLTFLSSLVELIMPTNDELLAEIADLKQAVVDDQTSDQAVVTKLDGIIADLKAGSLDGTAIAAALADVKAAIAPVTSTNG